MKKILNDSLTEILRNRIFISRKIKIYKIKDIAKEWNISEYTVFRYDSPRLREISRVNERRKRRLESKKDKSLCQICFKMIKGHPRCKVCTRLAHNVSNCLSCGNPIEIALTVISIDNKDY